MAPTTTDSARSTDWEAPLAELLADLSATQGELLAHLGQKQRLLVKGDREGLAAIEPEGQRLAERLDACQQRRQSLLDEAADAGSPSNDLQSLAETLPLATRKRLKPAIAEARAKARMLQHQSLANWVLVQRTLLHLSQLIEIVATGGEKPPTYRRSGPVAASGALVDRAV
jgi:flagellar biosynthesis/type III secretory pathway chaperone